MTTNELETRKSTLERRLEDGWTRIGEAERLGKDVEKWEEFWMTLLREYERTCDELSKASAA